MLNRHKDRKWLVTSVVNNKNKFVGFVTVKYTNLNLSKQLLKSKIPDKHREYGNRFIYIASKEE